MSEAAEGCSHRCGGDCCRNFTISGGIDRLEQARAKAAEIDAWVAGGGGPLEPWMEEQKLLAEMLVPLGRNDEGALLYGCSKLDEATGACTVYDRRPAMCRRYPANERDRRCLSCGFVAPDPGPDLSTP